MAVLGTGAAEPSSLRAREGGAVAADGVFYLALLQRLQLDSLQASCGPTSRRRRASPLRTGGAHPRRPTTTRRPLPPAPGSRMIWAPFRRRAAATATPAAGVSSNANGAEGTRCGMPSRG